MLKHKSMPWEFWGEAVSTTIYWINRAPTKIIERITPYDGKKPHVSHFQIFRCLVNVKTLGGSLKNLDDHNKLMVFIGYEKGSKGYRAGHLVDEKIHLIRDAIFYEEKGWN